jgi:hypothetical protein
MNNLNEDIPTGVYQIQISSIGDNEKGCHFLIYFRYWYR